MNPASTALAATVRSGNEPGVIVVVVTLTCFIVFYVKERSASRASYQQIRSTSRRSEDFVNTQKCGEVLLPKAQRTLSL
jgi:hypothetical protein